MMNSIGDNLDGISINTERGGGGGGESILPTFSY
jgi:hypothetical protein